MKLNTATLTGSLSTITGNNLRPTETSAGTPLHIPVGDIQENPNNPRNVFERGPLQELADDISVSGVTSPVSVFKSPEGSKKPYTLNYGARRLKASKLAKKATIPAFVGPELGPYERVSENDKREGLAPMELAEFIRDRLTSHGEDQKQVAKRLGKPESVISDHVKLLTLEPEVKASFERGQITAARAAVDLSNLIAAASDDGKEAITERLASDEPVTRQAVAKLKTEVKPKAKKKANSSGRIATKKAPATQAKTEAEADAIRALLPTLNVKLNRRKGTIAHNHNGKSPAFVWVLFNDKPAQIEQVKASTLTIESIEVEQ